MSVSSYRPGVYSSYTIAPSYTGTREALTVGVLGTSLGLEKEGPVLVSRGDSLNGGTKIQEMAELLFGAGLGSFWACSLEESAEAGAWRSALEALGEAASPALVAVENAGAEVLALAKAWAEDRSKNQQETLIFAGTGGDVGSAAALAKGVNSPRVVLSFGEAAPQGLEAGSPFWGALALCAAVAVLEDPSVSLTGEVMPGLARVAGAGYAQVETLLAAGVTPLCQAGSAVEAVRVLTTSTTVGGSPNRSFSPINSVLIVDFVMKALRQSLGSLLRGAKNSQTTLSAVASQLTVLLGDFLDRGIITGFEAPRVSIQPDAPEVCVAQVAFTAAYLINQIQIRAQIQL